MSSLLVLVLAGLGMLLMPGASVGAKLQDAATPATGATPEAVATESAAPLQVVTIVAWYSRNPKDDTLNLSQLRTNNSLVASQETGNDRALTGDVDFESEQNDGLPRIRIGDSAFEAYALDPEDPDSAYRWVYTDDDPDVRPATLVLQIEAKKGPYKGSTGTATFISRATGDNSSGVLVIVLNPPSE